MQDTSLSDRRPRSTAAERAQWAQRFHRSGLSQREFAAHQGLGLSTLQRWLRAPPAAAPAPTFTEVKVPAPGAGWAAEVVRPDGVVVRLAPAAPPAWWDRGLAPC